MPPRLTLTIDNGPTPGVTEHVHEVLDRHGVTAMFFVVGRNLVDDAGSRLVEQVVAAGHLVGSHTWSHTVTFGHAPDADVDRELDDGCRAVADAGGDGHLFRPYGGRRRDRRPADEPPRRASASSTTAARASCGTRCPGTGSTRTAGSTAALDDVAPPAVVGRRAPRRAGAAAGRLDDFLTRCADTGVELTVDVPDSCTPIRAGVADDVGRAARGRARRHGATPRPPDTAPSRSVLGAEPGERLAQVALEDLAARVLRQAGDELDVLRALVAGEAGPGVLEELVGVTVAPGLGTTTAVTASTQYGCGMPNTATSATAGCSNIASSTSRLATFSPPLLIMSFLRSTTAR